MWKDLLLIGESSHNPIMRHSTMFPAGGAAATGLARPTTAGSNFRTQVQTLMDTLSRGNCLYVRCIKPSDTKKAGVIDKEMMLNQIRYLGLLENVKVRRAGFAFRQTFPRFVARYKMLSPTTWPTSSHLEPMQACRAIMSAMSIAEGSQYQLGKTKIFIRQPVSLFTLEELRERKLQILATLIQKIYRSYRTRKFYRELRSQSLALFGRSKLRRKASVRRHYVGDYLGLAGNPIITKLLCAQHKEKGTLLFSDEIDKINRKNKSQRRILLLTPTAIYNLAPGKYKCNRRIELKDVSGVSVSPLADNFVVLQVAKEYDYVFVAERKTELLTALNDAIKTLTGQALPISYSMDINVKTKNKDSQRVVFVKNESQRYATHSNTDAFLRGLVAASFTHFAAVVILSAFRCMCVFIVQWCDLYSRSEQEGSIECECWFH